MAARWLLFVARRQIPFRRRKNALACAEELVTNGDASSVRVERCERDVCREIFRYETPARMGGQGGGTE